MNKFPAVKEIMWSEILMQLEGKLFLKSKENI